MGCKGRKGMFVKIMAGGGIFLEKVRLENLETCGKLTVKSCYN